MHRALYLPEIVSAIVRAGKSEPGFLHNCLFVNRLISHESCRILWKGCYGIFEVSHVTPKVCDLAALVECADGQLERAQYYANFVRILVFQQDEFTGEDDARLHSRLRPLQFPLLEDLNIWKTDSSEDSNTEETILHYVHPGLRDLRVDASSLLGDSFLDEISRLCPLLQTLDVDFKNVAISQQGLARFLQRMSALRNLHVAALARSWSLEAFVALAKHERLELLHVPAIQEDWFDALGLERPTTFFPALKYLYCLNTSGEALKRLHQLNPELQAVHIYNRSLSGREDVLQAVARFPRLTNVRYEPGSDAQILGKNLLQLARSCPCIETLSIGQGQMPLPTSFGLNDSITNSIAEYLPSLREVTLLFEPISAPSIGSILFGFSECPELRSLDITCGSDWDVFINAHSTFVFQNLWALTLHPQAHMEDALTDIDNSLVLIAFESYAEEWFPKMEFFNIDDADEWEQQLDNYMFQLYYKRNHGDDSESVGAHIEWVESDDDDAPL